MSVLLVSLIGLTVALALFQPFDSNGRSIIRLEHGEGAIALASKVGTFRTTQWMKLAGSALVIRAMAAKSTIASGRI